MVEDHVIYLAGGCFWGTEAYLRKLPGVLETQVGYANGLVPAPTYRDVCAGITGAAECVAVRYDALVITLPLLLEAFFRTIDPLSIDRQGNDCGSQYRTGVYWVDPADEPIVREALEQLRKQYGGQPLAVEAQPLRAFYPAEEYHQDYLAKNPGGYCHVDLADADRFVCEHERDLLPQTLAQQIADRPYEKPPDSELLELLSPEAYVTTQHSGTEPPWSSPLNTLFDPGIYVDAVTGEPLFSSRDKFHTGCGWPAFSQPIDPSVVTEQPDYSLASHPRTEVRSRAGSSHLGHVFDDGPAELGGKRYCINGTALRFVPQQAMEAEGYGYLLGEL